MTLSSQDLHPGDDESVMILSRVAITEYQMEGNRSFGKKNLKLQFN